MTEANDSDLNERESKRARVDPIDDTDNKKGNSALPERDSSTACAKSVSSECASLTDKSSDANDVVEDESVTVKHSCAICMRNETDGQVELLPHHCSQCRSDAWKVCASCEAALLSRECPLCRASYAPKIFYVLGDEDLLGNNSVFMKIYLISQESVLVYDRSNSVMYFSLPKDASLPKHEIEYVTCRMPMDASRVESGQFLFTNEVWNELEALEDGHEVVDIRHTLRNLTQVLSSPNAQLFSPYQTNQILDMIEMQDD